MCISCKIKLMKKQVYIKNVNCRHCRQDIHDVLMTYECIEDVIFCDEYMEIVMNAQMDEQELIETIENCGNYIVDAIV